jgi:hypothetical protein
MKTILEHLKDIPREWDGKKSILEMKDNGSTQWRQMEWIGFYFQFLCEKSSLKTIAEFRKIKYGNTSLDGFLEVPFDMKVHVLNASAKDLILNDTEATEKAIEEFGFMLEVIALGNAVYDFENGPFYKWHEELKGGKSSYEEARIERGAPSRLRKTSFKLEKIVVVKIDKISIMKSKSFQEGMRNSNGVARRKKVMFNLKTLLEECEIVEKIEF